MPDVPVGGIVLWSAALGGAPAGYQVCDGTNGTPDLRDSFVLGAGGAYAVGATGGDTTIDVPSHTHAPVSVVTQTSGTGHSGNHYHSGWEFDTETASPGETTIYDGVGPQETALGVGGSHSHHMSYTNTDPSGVHTHPTLNSPATVSGSASASVTGYLPTYYALYFIERLS